MIDRPQNNWLPYEDQDPLIDKSLEEYQWPSNPKNAARAGFRAAEKHYVAILLSLQEQGIKIDGPPFR